MHGSHIKDTGIMSITCQPLLSAFSVLHKRCGAYCILYDFPRIIEYGSMIFHFILLGRHVIATSDHVYTDSVWV